MKYTGGVRITLTSTARPEFRAVHHRRRGRPLRWHCAAPVRPPLRRVVAPAGRPRVPGPAHADAHLRAVARRAVAALRQRRGPLPARQHRGPPGCAPRSAAATATRRHVTTHCRHAPLPARTSELQSLSARPPLPQSNGACRHSWRPNCSGGWPGSATASSPGPSCSRPGATPSTRTAPSPTQAEADAPRPRPSTRPMAVAKVCPSETDSLGCVGERSRGPVLERAALQPCGTFGAHMPAVCGLRVPPTRSPLSHPAATPMCFRGTRTHIYLLPSEVSVLGYNTRIVHNYPPAADTQLHVAAFA